MNRHQHHATASGRRGRALPTLAAAALVLALLGGAGVAAGAASGGSGEVSRLRAELIRMTRLVNRRLAPAAGRLATDLPAEREQLGRLREPASTAQAQAKTTLNQLQEMTSVATLDPHYMPALVAAGRAYTAVSGLDPVTGTAISAEYLGLERELTTDGEAIDRSATDANRLATTVKRLREGLGRAQRRARSAERQLQRMRARTIRHKRR